MDGWKWSRVINFHFEIQKSKKSIETNMNDYIRVCPQTLSHTHKHTKQAVCWVKTCIFKHCFSLAVLCLLYRMRNNNPSWILNLFTRVKANYRRYQSGIFKPRGGELKRMKRNSLLLKFLMITAWVWLARGKFHYYHLIPTHTQANTGS